MSTYSPIVVCCGFGLSLALATVLGAQPLGDEFQVNSYTSGNQSDPSVTVDSAGRFVVAFEQDYSNSGPAFRRFTSDGTPIDFSDRYPANFGPLESEVQISSNGLGRFAIAFTDTGVGSSRALFLDSAGDVQRFVQLFVNGVELPRDALDTQVSGTDCVAVLAAAAGG